MKKGLLFVVCAAALATSTFAFDLSVGGGFQWGNLWVISTFRDDVVKTKPIPNGGFGIGKHDGTEKVDAMTITDEDRLGFDIFVDATYAEVDIGMLWSPVGRLSGPDPSGNGLTNTTGTDTYINVSALGKYPFKINDRVTIFPLLGIDYQIFLSATDGQGASWGRYDEYGKSDAEGKFKREAVLSYFDDIWIKLGAGVDVALTDRFFLRNEFLWGFDLREELLNSLTYYNDIAVPATGITKMEGFAHGLTYKLAVGYKIINGK
ncbi:hypothetical protein AGMMS4952_21610 [Spirochaetia bacterium]|nr:hypothetical protein AGMMS4952_21610 [Spirochaetia bacterium]